MKVFKKAAVKAPSTRTLTRNAQLMQKKHIEQFFTFDETNGSLMVALGGLVSNAGESGSRYQ